MDITIKIDQISHLSRMGLCTVIQTDTNDTYIIRDENENLWETLNHHVESLKQLTLPLQTGKLMLLEPTAKSVKKTPLREALSTLAQITLLIIVLFWIAIMFYGFISTLKLFLPE